MKSSACLLIFVFFSQILAAQSEKMLQGKINANGNYAGGIAVVNLVTEKETVTNEAGEFKIAAKPHDLLVFSSLNFEYKRKIVEKEDFESGKMIIEMIPKATQLDAVTIEEYRLDAVGLGILKKPAKQYTPAERRFKTAAALDYELSVGPMMGGTLGLDPLWNWISGRTAMLKKGVEVEQKEKLLGKIDDLYKEDFFSETLQIPKELVPSFKYYAAESKDLRDALDAKNKPLSDLILIQLSEKFKKLDAYEK